jgi:hypothetical protein
MGGVHQRSRAALALRAAIDNLHLSRPPRTTPPPLLPRSIRIGTRTPWSRRCNESPPPTTASTMIMETTFTASLAFPLPLASQPSQPSHQDYSPQPAPSTPNLPVQKPIPRARTSIGGQLFSSSRLAFALGLRGSQWL